jgi:hypothetical protein
MGEGLVEGGEDAGAGLDEDDAGAPGSMLRKSLARVKRLISPRAPASSTPVGPPPMTTKVRSLRWRAGSVSFSASSKAVSMRRRISVASSRDLRPGAKGSHSSWPK